MTEQSGAYEQRRAELDEASLERLEEACAQDRRARRAALETLEFVVVAGEPVASVNSARRQRDEAEERWLASSELLAAAKEAR